MYELWGTKAIMDKKELGPRFLDWGSGCMNRYMEARARLKLDGRIVDARYEDIRDNAMPIMKEVYRRANLELTAEAEQAMAQWEKTSEQGKYGRHTYSPEEFGISDEQIDESFAEYIRCFIRR